MVQTLQRTVPVMATRDVMTEPRLPRLCYVADVPVESSQHGSALMFRLFEQYPTDRLRIVETGLSSLPDRRLPNVPYSHLPIGRRRWLNTRLHGIYSAWLYTRATSHAAAVLDSCSGFGCEAVVTVGHGFGWLTAAELARRLRVPLHMIVHDDWPRLSAIFGPAQPWLERQFARVYRAAATRLCVSPFMAAEYERRYSAAGSVMYPSRSDACPVFPPREPRDVNAGSELTIGYGGNSGPEMMQCLETLGAALQASAAKLVVFGPFDEQAQSRLQAVSPAIVFAGFVPYQEMITGLRDAADVLFVPMSFEQNTRDNQVVSFPSKLADYTATGLPLLIYAPAYSSAARWARANPSSAEIVDEPGAEALRSAISRLRDATLRRRLAESGVAYGHRCFDPDIARRVLAVALTGPHQ